MLLTTGSTGAQVLQVTTLLSRLGYAAAPTSSYTADVAAAVKKFQSSFGILADGKTGPQTLTLLVLIELVKRTPKPELALALSIVWHESGFYPWAQVPASPATPTQYGLFLLAPSTPGNVKVNLPIGTKQSDAEITAAIAGIQSQWSTGLAALKGLSELVARTAGWSDVAASQQATWMRLVAMGHRVGRAPSCLQAILTEPSVRAAGFSWRAVAAAAAASKNILCTAVYQAAISNGYVDKVMASAALYAGAMGWPTTPYTADGNLDLALNVPLLPPAAPAPAPTAPGASLDQPPAQATLPPELQPGAGDKLPITTTVPAIPSSPGPAVPAGPTLPPGTQVATAGAGDGLVAAGLVLTAIILAASSKGGGGRARKTGARKPKAKRRAA